MFKITQTVAGAATLVLAALPMVALSTAAHAAPQTVQVSDLNLASPAGQQVLGHRVDQAARDFCRNQEATSGRINARAACLSGIRAEASEKVAALREMNLASR